MNLCRWKKSGITRISVSLVTRRTVMCACYLHIVLNPERTLLGGKAQALPSGQHQLRTCFKVKHTDLL